MDHPAVLPGGPAPARELWCAITLPALMLEVRPTSPEMPVGILDVKRREIVAANKHAIACGVRVGQSSTSAWAVCSDLVTFGRDSYAETRAIERIASWAIQFSPRLICESQDVILEIGASLKFFGGLNALIGRIKTGIIRLGYSCMLGVAPTPLAAVWLAHAGEGAPVVTEQKHLAGALAPLPITAMRLDGKTHHSLAELGVYRIGDLMRLPRAGLGKRYGIKLLDEIDRALGRQPDPRPVWEMPATFDSEVELPVESTSLGLLSLAYIRLTEELAGFLLAREIAVRNLVLFLDTALGTLETHLEFHQPMRKFEDMHVLIVTRLESILLPAPVRKIGLRVTDFVEAAPERRLPIVKQAGTGRLDCVIDRIKARLGKQSVVRLGVAPDHRPEYATQALLSDKDRTKVTGFVRFRWPLLMFSKPHRLREIEGRPSFGRSPLCPIEGPERIETGWWNGLDIARDYYRVNGHNGAEHWVYHDRFCDKWFLHGHFL